MKDYDCIVIGVGAMGSSACYQLARRGARVLGLERFAIPHDQGSSHGDSRMIRLVYYEHEDYVPLLRRAYEGWEALERESGRRLLFITGGLYMGAADGEIVTGTLRSARAHDLPHELLDRTALRRRFPVFRVPDDHVGVFEPRAGYLLPELAISTFAERALEHGAVLHGHERVLALRDEGERVEVTSERAVYRASQVIVCGGAWAGPLLGDIGVRLRPTRQPVAWVWPKRPALFREGALPVWAIDHPGGALHYGFPMRAGRPGFKLGYHAPLQDVDPERVSRTIESGDEETFRSILRTCLPDADGPLLSLGVCLYTYSPDSHFIIDRHPDRARVLLGCGFSGHGFKFAPVVGEILADLALEGRTRLPAAFLGLSRFA